MEDCCCRDVFEQKKTKSKKKKKKKLPPSSSCIPHVCCSVAIFFPLLFFYVAPFFFFYTLLFWFSSFQFINKKELKKKKIIKKNFSQTQLKTLFKYEFLCRLVLLCLLFPFTSLPIFPCCVSLHFSQHAVDISSLPFFFLRINCLVFSFGVMRCASPVVSHVRNTW